MRVYKAEAFGHTSFFWMHFNDSRILSALGEDFRHTAEESKTHTLLLLYSDKAFLEVLGTKSQLNLT